MRYQVIQLIQLLFALTLVFAAFAGGVAVGWWGRGRASQDLTETEGPHTGSGALFSPADRHDEVVLAEVDLRHGPGLPGGDGVVFGTGRIDPQRARPSVLRHVGGPLRAIGPDTDDSRDPEALEA